MHTAPKTMVWLQLILLSFNRRGHYGSFLMEEWDLIASMISTLHKELKVPVTAKIRVFDNLEKTKQYVFALLVTHVLAFLVMPMANAISGLHIVMLLGSLRYKFRIAQSDFCSILR